MNSSLVEKIKSKLNEIRPMLQRDGGDLEFIELTPDNILRVKLTGACSGCPMSSMTLKMGVEAMIKESFPEIKSVEDVEE